MGNADRPELAAELSTLFCELDPKVAQQFARATFLSDYRNKLAGFRVPTLIMQCAEDVVAPVEAGRFINQAVLGSKLVQLEATGHVPQISAPEETIAVMKKYLAR
jgi:sigma-B regulation protein RsbQ